MVKKTKTDFLSPFHVCELETEKAEYLITDNQITEIPHHILQAVRNAHHSK